MEIDDDMSMLDMSGNEVLSMDCENYDLNELLASTSSESSYDWDLKCTHGENTEELLRKVYSSPSPNNPFPSLYEIYKEGVDSLHGDSSCVGDQLKATTEAQVVLSDKDSTDVLLKPNSSMNSLIAQDPYFDAWSGEVSSFDSLGQQLLSETRAPDVADVCSGEENAFACSKLTVQDSALTSLYSMNNSLDNQYSSQASVATEVDFSSISHILHGVSKNLEPVDMSEEFLKFSSMDDLCQWFAPSPEDSTCRTVSALDNTLSESMEFDPTSFGLVGSECFTDLPVTFTTEVNSDGKETSAVMHCYENSLLESLEPDLSSDQGDEMWGNMLTPVVSSADDTGYTECISQLDVDTLKGLFSELGIEELLSGEEANYDPLNSSYFDDELSANKVEMEDVSPVNRNPVQFTNLAWPEGRTNLMQPISDLDGTNNLISKKVQVGLFMDDSHRIKLGETVLVHPQKKEEPKKPSKKKDRPGESTRPRPKDRQRIQDCIQQLRGIIPGKDVKECSIDNLLECSIRYMIFLASTAYYANKLQEPDKPKLIEQANGVILQDSSVEDGKNCDTWSVEVAGQTLVCPIIVEDMDHPGQMLIEMLCEEQGFSLELADIIRGLGLNILKAKMEIRNKKLWARFIVEANRHVTRIDVFWSLLHLLQQKNTSGMDSANKHCNVSDASISGLDRQLPEKKSCHYSWP